MTCYYIIWCPKQVYIRSSGVNKDCAVTGPLHNPVCLSHLCSNICTNSTYIYCNKCSGICTVAFGHQTFGNSLHTRKLPMVQCEKPCTHYWPEYPWIDLPSQTSSCVTQIHEGWQAQSEGSPISEIDVTLMANIATNDTVDFWSLRNWIWLWFKK